MKKSILSVVVLLPLLACGGSNGPAEPEPTPPSGVLFTFTPPAGAPAVSSVAVAGGFNSWSTTATRMSRQGGSWQVRVPLADGQHEYKFHINGAWPSDMCDDRTWGDPANEYWIHVDALGCVPDGFGGRNAVVGVGTGAPSPGLGFVHDPADPAHVSAAGGRISVRFHANPGETQSATLQAGGQTYAMHRQLTLRFQEVWRGTMPEGTASYTIRVQTAGGPQERGPFTVPAGLFRAVPWVGSSIGYQIFPERFWNGDPSNDHFTLETDEHPLLHSSVRGAPPVLTPEWDGPVTDQHCCHQYFGGDLQGIIDRLDHVASLGVSLVYMNPIFRAGSAHGYDTWDYTRVDPALGDTVVLRALMQAAEARGIRLMWDFVPNHVGVGFPQFLDAVEKGPQSPYWLWFNFKVPAPQIQIGNGTHYDAWWGFGSLPELNTARPAVMTYLMDVVRQWTQFGFEGIRVDVPGDIGNRAEFFSTFRQTAKGIDPDVYLVGEIWQRSADWLEGDEFDALMNYAIGQDVIERYATGVLSARDASYTMSLLYGEYPEAAAAMGFNLISSHDTGRLLTKMGGGALGAAPDAESLARQRLASAMLYALPGMPVTFQGDECAFLGAGGGPREENRYPLQWSSCDAAMVAHYRQLAALRSDHAALESPAIRMHHAQGTVLAWLRGEPGTGEVLAVFNAGATDATVPLPAGSWSDAATGASPSGSATVGARGWRYLVRN